MRAGSTESRAVRLVTGTLGLFVLVLVIGIGVELARNARLSIVKFGLGFWSGTTWDPVAGEFGALPFIWGTLYSSLLALLLSTPVGYSKKLPERPPSNTSERSDFQKLPSY